MRVFKGGTSDLPMDLTIHIPAFWKEHHCFFPSVLSRHGGHYWVATQKIGMIFGATELSFTSGLWENGYLLTLFLPASFSLLSTCYTREKPPVDWLPAEMMLMESFTADANDGRCLFQSLSSLSPHHHQPQPQHLGWSRWPSWIIKFYISWHVLHCTL